MTATGQPSPIRGEVEGNAIAGVSAQATDQSARGDLPDLQADWEDLVRKKSVGVPKPATRYFPSGENARERDHGAVLGQNEVGQIGHSWQAGEFPAGVDVPERDVRCVQVSAVAHSQQTIVGGRERHAIETALLGGGQFAHEFPRGSIPQPHARSVGGGDQEPIG